MTQKTILIVEDDPVARHVSQTALKGAGFATIVAGDALGALAQTQRNHPDLIILDLGLPAGGGLAFLQRKSAIPAISLIPVLVISGQERVSAEGPAIESGASAYLQKPAMPEEIVAKVRELLGT